MNRRFSTNDESAPSNEINDLVADFHSRYIGVGFLRGLVVVIVFTDRGEDTIRIISLRKALKHERDKFEQRIRD
jgi:uncharacterized DUF497 family protein